MIRIKKGEWWENLLKQLAFSNAVMIIVWVIQVAFGYQPYYLMSLTITNVLALIFWVASEFDV